MQPKVVAIGSPVSDYIYNIDRLPVTNHGAKLLGQSWQYGGKVCTGIVTVGCQGIPAGIVGVVGDDPNGAAQFRDFQKNGVDTSRLIRDPDVDTAFCIALAEKETGGRSFIGGLAKTRLIEAHELDRDYICGADYLMLERNTEACRQAAQWMLDKGGEIMFDADWYDESQEAMIPYTTVFVPSEFYYKTRYGDRDPLECCREMQALGPHTVIITLGEKGCVGISPDGPFEVPAYKVDVVDTTGAGDTFHGAYVSAMIRGLDAPHCAQWASATSAIKCTAIGGRAGQPTAEMVERFIKTGEIDRAYIDERVAYYAKPPY